MKTPSKLLIAALCLTTVTFCWLWQAERRDRSDLILLAQANAATCAGGFEDYLKTGDDAMYWSAVADFRAFEQAYLVLSDGTAGNYIFCNEVYARLVFYPEVSKRHVEEVAAAMRMLAADVRDPAGFVEMAALRHDIQD
ncbi:MAG TPA: hypothetical protein VN446_00540 [Candidatus Acidoferrum sp.]|nr:hypothetical protein [Candidatus Acidoferrum sp.]